MYRYVILIILVVTLYDFIDVIYCENHKIICGICITLLHINAYILLIYLLMYIY